MFELPVHFPIAIFLTAFGLEILRKTDIKE